MKTKINLALSVSILVLISACADPQPDHGNSSDIKPGVSISKKKETRIFVEKSTILEKFNDHLLSDKKEQVLSAIDEGLQMIDRELVKDPHPN